MADITTRTSTPLKGILSPGFDDDAFAFRRQSFVGSVCLGGSGILDRGRSVVHEGYRRHLGEQGRRVVHVVQIVVRGDQDVELLHVGGLGRFDDAVCVAVVIAGEASVEQHGLAGRRDDEQRLAALGVDNIHVEALRGGQDKREGQNQESRQQESLHGVIVSTWILQFNASELLGCATQEWKVSDFRTIAPTAERTCTQGRRSASFSLPRRRSCRCLESLHPGCQEPNAQPEGREIVAHGVSRVVGGGALGAPGRGRKSTQSDTSLASIASPCFRSSMRNSSWKETR